jgi:hypothetical protein
MKLLLLLCTACLFSDVYELDMGKFRNRKTPYIGIHPGVFCTPPNKIDKPPEDMCVFRGYSQVVLKNRSPEGLGYKKGYSTLELFLAPANSEGALPFVDVRGHLFNNGKEWAANAGLGVRVKWDDLYFGSNVYYDYRSGMHQVSGGLELISTYCNLTLGGYFPTSRGLPLANLDLTSMIPFGCSESYCNLTLGGYYLFNKNEPGGKGELAFHITRWFSFGGTYTYDRVFRSRMSGFAQIHIPFGRTEKELKTRSACSKFCRDQRGRSALPNHNEIIVKAP